MQEMRGSRRTQAEAVRPDGQMEDEPDIEAANAAFQLAPASFEPDVPTPPRKREEPLAKKITYLPDVHKLLPQSPESEQGVLSSFMLAPREVGSMLVQKRIKSDVFHIPAHKIVFDVLMQLWNDGKPCDFIHLAQTLRDRGELERVGGAPFISSLFTYLPTAANAAHYLEIVEEKAALRRIIAVGTEYASRSYDEQDEVPGILEGFERDVMAIRRTQDRGGMTAKEVMAIGINEIQRVIDLNGKIGGISTGFPTLDRITDGVYGSKVYGVCGLSGTGKSAIAMQMLEHMSVDLDIPTAVWPLEMGIKQMAKRQICSRARVNMLPLRWGERLIDTQKEKLAHAAAEISRAKMYFQPSSDCTIQQIRTNARHLVAMHGIKAILIDSMSVLHSDSRQAKNDRTREVAECAEGMKDMAKELDIAVFCIVHIDRKKDRNARPRANEVRESGQIEQAFDDLWMLYEPDYDENAGPQLDPRIGMFIPKQRDGEPNAEQFFHFEKRFTRFTEITPQPDESQGSLI